MIDTNGNALTIEGIGIVNNSGQTQTITNNGSAGGPRLTQFLSSSSAGAATITNSGPATPRPVQVPFCLHDDAVP